MEEPLIGSSPTGSGDPPFEPGADFARRLDERDPLAALRYRFDLPGGPRGPLVYLAGNSLGPLPRAARRAVESEVELWAARAVDGWFEGPRAWYGIDDRFLSPLGRLVGAAPDEVAVANALTVNLHLLLATFFRPRGRRRRILVERPSFPSDRFAVRTHLRWHGLDPDADLVEVGPPDGPLDEAEIERALEEERERIALVLVSGVNFLTGQRLDMSRIVEAAHGVGAVAGLDLAHAVGNVPLRLHDWDVDFAAWCHYKYVNAGPGAPGGIFVHRRHAADRTLPRLGGWWGSEPETRFRMREPQAFVPRADAGGWQLSTPPVLGLAPLGPALELFDEAGHGPRREKSERLTAYLEWLLTRQPGGGPEIVTPRDPRRRGAQLSLRVRDAERAQARLQEEGIVTDHRDPDIVRLAPAPLFNTYFEMWQTAEAVRRVTEESR